MNASEFLNKVVRMRAAMMRRGANKKDVALMSDCLKKVKGWVEAYTPTVEQCAAYIKRNTDLVKTLLPGGDSPQAKAWHNKLNDLLA